MKIGKHHFIQQDNAWKSALYDASSLMVSPVRYGVLPSSAAGEDTFNVRLSLDNQNTLRVSVHSCQAVTPGGIRINLPVFNTSANDDVDGVPATSFPFTEGRTDTTWWVVLTVHPYDTRPAGSPDLSENPPRYPYLLPQYGIEVVNESQYSQFVNHPYALTIGKVMASGSDIRVDQDYIPPCFSISAHPDLTALFTELDRFLSTLEVRCTEIVQKIYRNNQQNEISQLVLFLCDRMALHLAQTITHMRWLMIHESPAALFASVASLARVMKNTIDLRIGTGKEEMMNYLVEWCELKQGELETMLSNLANIRYDNNDINRNIQKVTQFVKITAKLFDTLSKLDFIGKRKDSGIFVKEETTGNSNVNQPGKPPRRRFFE